VPTEQFVQTVAEESVLYVPGAQGTHSVKSAKTFPIGHASQTLLVEIINPGPQDSHALCNELLTKESGHS